MKDVFMKKGVKWIVIAVLAIALATGIIVFARNKATGSYIQAERKKQSSIILTKMDLTKSISATGTIKSGGSKTVSAQLNGIKIKKVNVAAGDVVKKGDKLLEFNTDDLKEALEEAKENLADVTSDYNSSVSSAQNRLQDAQSTYNSDKNNLEKKISDIKKSLEDIKKQIKDLKKKVKNAKNGEEKMSLSEQLSKAEESKKSLENEYETAKNNRDNTNKQNKSSIDNASETLQNTTSNGKKSIKEAEKQVKEAKEQLAKCKVKATTGGTITAVYVEAGDTYSGGDIAQIDDISSFKVETSVDEYDISSISKGQRAVILTAATDEDELEGEITFVAPSTESTDTSGNGGMNSSSSSDGYEVEIALKTKDNRLRMGMTARCSIILEEVNDVYAVPYDAVHENRDGTSVIYVEEISGRPGNIEQAGSEGVETTEQGNKRQRMQESGRQGDMADTEQTEIEVTKGMESDYYVEISGDGLLEGLRVIIPTDSDVSSGNEEKEQGRENVNIPGMGGLPGGMQGGGMQGGGMQGGGSFGGGNGKGRFNRQN